MHTKSWRPCRAIGTLIHCWWEHKMVKASGKWLTETQQESIVKFRELNRQLSQLSDARQVAFVDGFMKSLDPKVTEEFMKNLLVKENQ